MGQTSSLCVLVLWAFEFLIAIKNAIRELIYFKFSNEVKSQKKQILVALTQYHFPKPTLRDIDSVDEYFQSCIENYSNTMECRIYARSIYTMLNLYVAQGKYPTYFLYSHALSDCLNNYYKTE